MKGVMQCRDRFARVAAPAHADFIYAVTPGVIADRQSKWQRVFNNHGISADISLAADAAELMHAGISPDVCAVFDAHMAGQGRRVSHNDVVANQTIMGDVRLGHQEAVIANFGDPAAAGGAAMNRHKLTDARAAANLSLSFLTREFQILRRQSNRYKRIQMRFITNTRAAVDHTM